VSQKCPITCRSWKFSSGRGKARRRNKKTSVGTSTRWFTLQWHAYLTPLSVPRTRLIAIVGRGGGWWVTEVSALYEARPKNNRRCSDAPTLLRGLTVSTTGNSKCYLYAKELAASVFDWYFFWNLQKISFLDFTSHKEPTRYLTYRGGQIFLTFRRW